MSFEPHDALNGGSIPADAAHRAQERALSVARFQSSLLVGNSDPAPCSITTPYGTDVLHPSVVFAPLGWNGYRYWLAATPIQGSDLTTENPCIWASQDGKTWVIPPGGSNPVIPNSGGSYNSDVHLVRVVDTLYLFYRVSAGSAEIAKYVTSTDGVTWSAPTTILTVTGAAGGSGLIAPVYTWDGANWNMWNVVSTASPPATVVLRTATSLAGLAASSLTTCTIPMPANREVWHFDVQQRGEGFVGLFMNRKYGGGGTAEGVVHVCDSTDGITWTTSPYAIGNGPWTAPCSLYRPCGIVRADGIDAWLSDQVDPSGPRHIGFSSLRELDVRKTDLSYFSGILAARLGLAIDGLIAGDTFDSNDSATTIGSADLGGVWSVDAGVFGIASGQAYNPSGTSSLARRSLNLGTPAQDVEVTFATVDPTQQQWLLFRMTDGSNLIRVGNPGTSLGMGCTSFVAGVATTILDVRHPSVLASGDRLRVHALGNVVDIYLNGRLTFSFTLADNNAGTRAGIQCDINTVRFDNFVARTAT